MGLSDILQASLSYPSGDNCQPFRFKILNAATFEIHHLNSVAAHRMNLNMNASLISLGCLLETIALNAKVDGFQMDVSLKVSRRALEDHQSWATVTLVPLNRIMSADEKMLQGALSIRGTNRGLYETGVLAEEDIRWLTQEAYSCPQIRFALHDKLSIDLEETLLSIEEEAWKDLSLAKDLLKWIRFTKRSATSTRDGLVWESLTLPWFHKPSLKMFKLIPNIYEFLAKHGSTKANRQLLKKQINASGGIGWIAVQDNSEETVVAAGRAIFRMWLYLNAKGYAYQPMTLATLPSFHATFSALPDNWSVKLEALYPKVTRLIQLESMMPASWIPIWGFRTGRAELQSEAARCLRKDLSDLTVEARV